MISVCIPVYNRDITTLVCDLHRQCESLDIAFEIVLIDDASEIGYKLKNKTLLSLKSVIYEELSENIGRSAIRNMLASKASYPYLIFVDNDAKVCSDDFIEKYIRQRSAGIVCYGGTAYDSCPSDEFKLRWLFGKEREQISLDKRKQNPDSYFSTFNFMIDKRLVLLYPFDEQIKGYGYEDVLFHLKLIKEGFHISQIDNPLIHEGLISNEEFLQKTENAVKNLHFLLQKTESKSELFSHIKLLKTYHKVEKFKLVKVLSCFFSISGKYMKQNLLSKKPRLLFLDLYKLGYLCSLKMNKTC